MTAIREISGIDPRTFRDEVVEGYAPVVLRGAAREWPVVATSATAQAACDYLLGFDKGAAAEAWIGAPEINGRFFYSEDMKGFNFDRRKGSFAELLRYLLRLQGNAGAPSVYAGAMETSECLPGFTQANPMPLVEGLGATPRVWVGNASIVSPHFDASDNVAVVAAGRRRFTLFPPDQVHNLYVGPLDHNMAGRPVSMVSLSEPDFERGAGDGADGRAGAGRCDLHSGAVVASGGGAVRLQRAGELLVGGLAGYRRTVRRDGPCGAVDQPSAREPPRRMGADVRDVRVPQARASGCASGGAGPAGAGGADRGVAAVFAAISDAGDGAAVSSDVQSATSIYAVARRHAIATPLAALAVIWGLPIALSSFGFSGEATLWIALPFALAWFLIGSVRSLRLRCPSCGKSLFTRNGVGFPWPERRCGKCATDLACVDRWGACV
jgi:hypothetical protein